MSKKGPQLNPLVSVVIPCYNQGHFLAGAIESALTQDYPAVEVVVVDDGSTDFTKEIAGAYRAVKYVYQPNQGLSSARNTGIKNASGDFLLFLDADDWLLPGAITTNVAYLLRHEQLAFVSGAHHKVYVEEGLVKEETSQVSADHYLHLLQGNYIGMISTVLFRKWVFSEFQYDTMLRNCEDYDLYLKITRKYPVFHHQEKIAAYRIHTANMSNNIPAMLGGVLRVLDRQKVELKSESEQKAYLRGQEVWRSYYCSELWKSLGQPKGTVSTESLQFLKLHRPPLYYKYILKKNTAMFKAQVKKYAPAFTLRMLHSIGLYNNHVPAPGAVELGDFDRVTPFSKEFGYDRGGPVDRHYIEGFLRSESQCIQGNVLEIGDNAYTLQFGGKQVTKSDILHVDSTNKAATYIGDISDAPHIPDSMFDCIILTQTLHLIYDFKAALRTCHRILKPGGVLLLTVPGITPIDHGEWKDTWYWAFTDKAMRKVMDETFPESQVKVGTYGNVLTAAAFLYGMGLQEVPPTKLNFHDPHYQVIVTVKAQKL
ncbi:glycosyltransferase [Pontibacter lucknowensis]|uniref:Methyltransferase domain-containing protein n=1 Tax=Pontibacter lucknowensis TaxID=1077936 RepID=A0A1N7AZ34_9BACT|nr:glycosyltransferase [Pontibacter lucknowensis]SIR44375.1 Methyltransferase domain-containing protein [Pontibacter lucknowensis]